MNSFLIKVAKLNVVRNIAVAFVIALAGTLITWVVYWKAQQNQAPIVQEPPPVVSIPVAKNEAANQPVTGTSDEKYIAEYIPAGDIYADKIAEHVLNNPRLRWAMEGFEVGQGEHFSFSVLVESDSGYRHHVQVMEGKPNSHTYQFPYSCGCEIMTSPDAYRDVIYADPQRVAARYSDRLCRDCTNLQAFLDERNADSDDSAQAE